jgi:uncharacterized protein YndB with AHSA1/START domain
MNQSPNESEVLIERNFDAPRTLLFKVWTDPFHLARWWTPYGFKATVKKMEVREGGVFHIELQSPDGQRFPAKAIFQKIIPPESIVLLGDAGAEDACGAGLPPNAVITISFTENRGQTTLRLHTLFKASAMKQAAAEAGYYSGWDSALGALQQYLDSIEEN